MDIQEKLIGGYRLSPQQKRLWLLQAQNGCLPYRAQCAILAKGPLKIDMLEMALGKVVERNEILRTIFKRLPEMTIPIQVVTDDCISLTHYSGRPEEDLSDESLDELINGALINQADRPAFDLEQGPLFHASLLRLTPSSHLLLFDLPALCADTTGLKNLAHEIGNCYADFVRGEEEPGEPMQYADLAEWQNGLLEKEETEAERTYWKQADYSALGAMKLPFEKRIAEPLDFDPARISLKLWPELAAKLNAVAGLYNSSASTILLACWHVLLWRLCEKSDVIIGASHNGRSYEGLEATLGLFEKYLPIRARLNDNLAFSGLLPLLDKAAREAAERQEYFNWEEFGSQDEGQPFFFPCCYSFEEGPERFTADEIRFSILKRYACVDRFKLKASFTLDDDSVAGELHYDRNYFRADDVQRLASHFAAALRSIIENPEQPVARIGIVTEAERRQLLIEFNETQDNARPGKLFLESFEEAASAYPNNVAVVVEDQRLTFDELNRRANRLAHYLRELGVGPDSLVPICFGRSVEMIVGMLGVLKAGGAYVPIDPGQPKTRLALMLEDLTAQVLLTQEEFSGDLPQSDARVIRLDADWDAISRRPDENLENEISGNNLFYVLFTSGSTGRPKGVGVEHRQVANYVHGIQKRLKLGPGASYATVSTFAADLGNTAILPSLSGGGCLHIISQERLLEPDALSEYAARNRIDCLKVVPAHLEALMGSSHPEDALPRKRLVLGGEASRWSQIERIRSLAPHCAIINHYGPTETTVGVLTHELAAEITASGGERLSSTVPLGRPIANTRIYALDSYMQPVPMWLPGELYVGGDCVARGYINRPDLTAEKFIPDPFGSEPGARLYKTGDLARHLPGSSLEFLGRIDNQVKLRGFRIELSEIESLLGLHPSVRKTVVIAQEDAGGENRLIAYVVANAGSAPTSGELKSYLSEKLPDYMLPAAFMFLRALPLMPNGKVDRGALPKAEFVRSEMSAAYVMPQNDIQRTIATVWEEVLPVEKVGIYDNFFDLGGHSLLMVKIHSKLQNTFERKISIVELFRYSTVSALGEFLSQEQSEQISFDKVSDRVKRQREAINRRKQNLRRESNE